MKKLISIFLIFSISAGAFIYFYPDHDYLGDDYYYLPPYEAIDVGFPGGAIIYRSPQKYSFNKIILQGEVIDIKHNEDFIIAVQQKEATSDLAEHKNGPGRKKLGYFIIDKKKEILFGPFTKSEFLQKCNEQGVPQDLVITESN